VSQQLSTPQREYETIYVLKPNVTKEASEGLAGRMSEIVGTTGAMLRVENWGRRKLAYTVAKQTRGVYVYMKYAGNGEIVTELERTLRLQESVMKFQTVKLSDAVEQVDVRAEDVGFEHIEEPEEEEEESLAQSLGLEGRGRYSGRDDDSDGDSDDDDSSDGSDDDSDSGSGDSDGDDESYDSDSDDKEGE